MSRTTRNNRIRSSNFGWWNAKEGIGDSKPYNERYLVRDLPRFRTWVCRCDCYCIHGKLHRNKRVTFDLKTEIKFLDDNYGD